MMYKRGQQVLVKVDVNNPSGWHHTHTTNMQWIKAVVVCSSDAMHTVSSFILHYPYTHWPTLQSGWVCGCTFNFSKVKTLEGNDGG
eukprot:4351651-Ditylum_brightwellii.AAC.1